MTRPPTQRWIPVLGVVLLLAGAGVVVAGLLPLASLDIRVDLHDHGKKAELDPPAEVKKKLGIR